MAQLDACYKAIEAVTKLKTNLLDYQHKKPLLKARMP